MLRSLTVAAALLAAPAALSAQEDDIEFARGLASRGWFDVAEDVCGDIQKNPRSSAETKGAVAFVRAEILVSKAGREADVDAAKKLIDDGVGLLEKFVKDFPAHSLVLDGRIMVGWLKARKGRLLTDAIETESGADKVGELQREAAKVYEEAEKYYADLLGQLAMAKSSDALEGAIMETKLELPRTMYEHAKLSGISEADRKKMLQEAVKKLEDFEFDYGNRPIGFKGMLIGGQCLVELGELKAAEAKLRGVAALKERLSEAGVKMTDFHHEILFGAYRTLMAMFNRSNRAAEAKTLYEQVLREYKGIEGKWMALMLQVELVDTLFTLKEGAKAQGLVAQIQKTDPGYFGAVANKKLEKWSGGGAGLVRVSPDQMMTSADTHYGRNNFRESIAALRRCIESATSEADRAKYVPEAWYKIGECLMQLQRRHEAATAFEMVFSGFPKHALAAPACYFTATCYNDEFAAFADRRDEELKKKYLAMLIRDYKDSDEAKGVQILVARDAETSGDRRRAADLYLGIPENVPAFEEALFRAAYCLRADAMERWNKAPRDPKVQEEVKAQMKRAEAALLKFLERYGNPALKPADPKRARDRDNLASAVNSELANIYMHDSVGRTAECLEFLKKSEKGLPADDERLARNWEYQVRANLTLGRIEDAVKTLDTLIERFPDSIVTARACKSGAVKLDEITTDLLKNKKDDRETIKTNLRRMSTYYAKWTKDGVARGLRATKADLISVADVLYFSAKYLNDLDETVISFVDLKDRRIAQPQLFNDAALVLTLLTDGQVVKIDDRDKAQLMSRLARCSSFLAGTADEWKQAKEKYDDIIAAFKLVDDNGRINGAPLQAAPELLIVYLELGHVQCEIARKSEADRFQYDLASSVFNNVLTVTQPVSPWWWTAKYMGVRIFYERGKDGDLNLARISIENLVRSYPDYDGGKFGMKERFLALKRDIEGAGGRK